MAADLFGDAVPAPVDRPLTVFHAELLGQAQANWQELFDGFTTLKAITFSSSIELLMQLVPRFADAEIVFGCETILSKEHRALLEASHTVETYGFADALVDHKALAEALARLLQRGDRRLIDRVANGSLRFRLLRHRPSHEKLYLLSGPGGHRVITGSANMSLAAFAGQQQEVYVRFDGEAAWQVFEAYYERDWQVSAPVEADLIITPGTDGHPPAVRTTPLELVDVPVVRVLTAGVAIAHAPPRPVPAGFTAESRATSSRATSLTWCAPTRTRAGFTRPSSSPPTAT